VLGIDSDSPGFKTVKIEPHLGALKMAKGTIPHPQGEIDVDYFIKNAQWQAKISLPPQITGRFLWKGKIFNLKPGENIFTGL
jgi:alpha-L-rhamnosidase